jgi:hypothetical protein
MKKLFWWILGIVIILLIPAIPYEKESQDGVVEVGQKSIAIYLFDRYKEVQKQNIEPKVEQKTEEKKKE